MNILCIKHIGFEGPAAIAQWAQHNGHDLDVAPVYHDQHLPSPEAYDAFIFMGGPMNVYDDEQYPWLIKEQAYIRNVIESGKHVLGICLGAQLIACAMGAKVTSGEHKEIGWFPIQRAPGCPSLLDLPEELTVFHWHGDTFALPLGAERIAMSAACPNQGFSYQGKVLALQCHLEMTAEGLALLAASCNDELMGGTYVQSLERLTAEPAPTYERMHAVLFQMLNAWIKA